MITNFEEFKQNENLSSYIRELNPSTKNKPFKKSSFNGALQLAIYHFLQDYLPPSYTFNIKKHGDANFIKIVDTNNKEYTFKVSDDDMTVFKIKNMIKSKFNLNESSDNDIVFEF